MPGTMSQALRVVHLYRAVIRDLQPYTTNRWMWFAEVSTHVCVLRTVFVSRRTSIWLSLAFLGFVFSFCLSCVLLLVAASVCLCLVRLVRIFFLSTHASRLALAPLTEGENSRAFRGEPPPDGPDANRNDAQIGRGGVSEVEAPRPVHDTLLIRRLEVHAQPADAR